MTVDRNKLLNNLPPDKIKEPVKELDKDIKDDYEYSRDKYRSILSKGETAIEGMLDLAVESESPRAYEVLSNMLKHMADTTDKLMDLQKKKKELTSNSKGENAGGNSLTQNNVYIGSTADLQRMLLDKKSQTIIDSED